MTTKRDMLGKKQVWVALMCALVAVSILGAMYYINNIMEDTIIGFDVNPSVEIVTNKKNEVLFVEAVNEDGEKIIGDMNFEGTDLNVTVNAIIGSMMQNGFMMTDDSQILVSVYNDDTNKAEKMKETIINDVNEALKNNDILAGVMNQVIDKDDKEEQSMILKFATEEGISFGKAKFIMEIIEEDPSLVKEELAKYNIKDIVQIVLDRNLDISDIIDLDDKYDDIDDDNKYDDLDDKDDDLDDKDDDLDDKDDDLDDDKYDDIDDKDDDLDDDKYDDLDDKDDKDDLDDDKYDDLDDKDDDLDDDKYDDLDDEDDDLDDDKYDDLDDEDDDLDDDKYDDIDDKDDDKYDDIDDKDDDLDDDKYDDLDDDDNDDDN